jgi:hypothetical protein
MDLRRHFTGAEQFTQDRRLIYENNSAKIRR